MFIDLNNLVQMQGEMVGRIEDHVNHAVIDIERGRDDLGKAEKFKKSANKKKFILIGIAVVIVLIVLLGKIFLFKPSFLHVFYVPLVIISSLS